MASNKVVVNLATGLEDSERVTVAFLVANAALEKGKQVAMFLTKEAVRIALADEPQGVACDGCPPLPRLSEQYAQGGGELLVCPICFNSRKLDETHLSANARLAGATPCGSGSATNPRPSSATDPGAPSADRRLPLLGVLWLDRPTPSHLNHH